MVMDIGMYCDYFKFITSPFEDGNYFNNIRLLAAQDFILQKLNLGGVAILSGNKGVGKTRLAHEIARRSQRRVLHLSAASLNGADSESLGQLLACCFQLKKWRALPPSIVTMRIAESFEHHGNITEPWLVVVDNAENLTAESYEFLRTFKAYPQSLRVSFLLVEEHKGGAGSRRHKKGLPHAVYSLSPMNFAETSDYLSQRLQAAGGEEGIFNKAAIELLQSASGGRFQLINALAADSLNSAYAEKTQSVTYRQMKVCVETRGLSPGKKKCLTLLIACYMLFGGVLGWTYFSYAKPYLPLTLTLSERLHEIPAAAKTLNDVGSNERNGMRQLFKVWGYDVPTDDAFCDQAVRAQLTCKKGKATLEALVQEGIPWVSPITTDKQSVYVTVVKVTDETLDILIKDETWTVQRSWFNEVWGGEYIQLFPQTPSGKNTINNTSSEADTAWLDMTLSKILNQPFSKTGRWDKDLIEKIKLFQQREDLVVDGRVGKGTLMQIAKRTGNMPVLLTKEEL
ncbi:MULTISPECIES: ExeA family protein [Rahnella]|uniref:AAA family ATPase n=3 Tax=Rahnella TaxID=34037 RepID=A0ABS6KW19_9GAMM|nr:MULTISPECIES: ExeA family protein [Rahnella]MBU9833462.1 AAA family ATPase [Rahnella perminowiae]MCR8998972.1 AAA family ATPase [Rahnella perminowiae]